MEMYFRYAPNVRQHILGRRVITPLDLERSHYITGGSISHASLVGLDNLFERRPMPQVASYRTPIAGYYLCGAGNHPAAASLAPLATTLPIASAPIVPDFGQNGTTAA